MKLHHCFAKTLSLIALCALLVSGTTLIAATVNYSNPIPASDGAGHGSLPTTAAFTLPQFDTALGTLTGIEVDFALSYQGEVDVINFTGSSLPFTNATSSVPIDISTPSSTNSLLVNASFSVASGVANSFAVTDFPGTTLSNTFPFNPVPADFSLYEGTGNSNYQLSYGTGTFGGTGAGVGFGGDANSSGTASVTYTYTAAVPEPSTIALFVLGIVGLIATARHGSRQRTTES